MHGTARWLLGCRLYLRHLLFRFGYDLLLWQPANGTAEKSSTKSMFVSCVDDVKSPVVKDTFRLCTSTIKRSKTLMCGGYGRGWEGDCFNYMWD